MIPVKRKPPLLPEVTAPIRLSDGAMLLANLSELPTRRFELTDRQRLAFIDRLEKDPKVLIGFDPWDDYNTFGSHDRPADMDWAKRYMSARFGRLFVGTEEIALTYPRDFTSDPIRPDEDLF